MLNIFPEDGTEFSDSQTKKNSVYVQEVCLRKVIPLIVQGSGGKFALILSQKILGGFYHLLLLNEAYRPHLAIEMER